MKIIVGEWFRIPQVERDIFRSLVREARLQYDKTRGYLASSETDLGLMTTILGNALKENVVVMLKCFICGTAIECEECKYKDVCRSSQIFQSCICKNCDTKEEVANIYSMRFTELIG
ncbi:MAG: hypothetical protein QGF64_03500 [Candidatus Poseidoniia archaeon]|mgnify:FL=1|nr:hypothetical protein [Candidatus Poseidoniia archaeon]